MIKNSKYRVMYFYSKYHQKKWNTEKIFRTIVNKYKASKEIEINGIEFNEAKKLCDRYHIIGTPTILFLKDNQLVQRYLGEIMPDEFEKLLRELLQQKTSHK